MILAVDNSTFRPYWPRVRFVSTDGLSAASGHYVKSGESEEIRAKRRERIEALRPQFSDIVGRIHYGTQPMEPSSYADIDGRIVCVLGDVDQLIVRCIDQQAKLMLREAVPVHPDLQLAAYPLSVPDALWGVIRDSEAIAQTHGEARVLLFDVVKAYKTLIALIALTRLADVTGAKHIIEALRRLYEWVLLDRRFRGIQEGPSTSPLLFDLAILPLELLLSDLPGVRVRRYVDNIALIYPPTITPEAVQKRVHEALSAFKEAEGVELGAHEWEEGTYTPQRGFAPSITWLGIELSGHERTIKTKKLADIREKLGRKEETEAQRIVATKGLRDDSKVGSCSPCQHTHPGPLTSGGVSTALRRQGPVRTTSELPLPSSTGTRWF